MLSPRRQSQAMLCQRDAQRMVDVRTGGALVEQACKLGQAQLLVLSQ